MTECFYPGGMDAPGPRAVTQKGRKADTHRSSRPDGKADTHRSSRPDGNIATAMRPALLGRACSFARAYARVLHTGKADTHRSCRPDGNVATAMRPALLRRALQSTMKTQSPVFRRPAWPITL